MYHDVVEARLPPKLADVGPLLTKAGVRGAPGVDDAQALLALTLLKEEAEAPLLDLQAMSGLIGRAVPGRVTLAERSAAALDVLRRQFGDASAALPGADLGTFSTVSLVLSGDRGNDHVSAMLAWAVACTAPGGVLYLAGDKQKGFERYFKAARDAMGDGEVVGRDGGIGGARLVRRLGTVLPQPDMRTYSVGELTVRALPGVFSAAGIDRASALLLQNLGDMTGKRVLDLGCGAGILGAAALAWGARLAVLLDDDLAAVRSTEETLRASGLSGDARHSDVGSALRAGETFDLIVSNPPFHVGRRVVLDVAEEFIRVGGERLVPGGEMRLVANDFLPYEGLLARWGRVDTLTREGRFKILRCVKR